MKIFYKIKKLYYLIKFYFRIYGFNGGIKFAYGLLKSGIEYIYIYNLALDKTNFNLINSLLTFKLIETPDQFDSIYNDYCKIKGSLLAQEDKQRVISKKELLGVVYKDEILAGWGWVKLDSLKYGDCILAENDCMIHKCRTLRIFRRQKVYTTLLINLMRDIQQKNFSNVYIGAKSFNVPSLKAIEMVGFSRIKEFSAGFIISRVLNHLRGIGSSIRSGK